MNCMCMYIFEHFLHALIQLVICVCVVNVLMFHHTGPVFAKNGIINVIFVLFNYYLNSFLASVATSRHSRDNIYSTCVRVISTTMCI